MTNIEKIFTYHPPKDENVMKFIDIREKAK